MSNHLRELQSLRKQLPTTRGCDTCIHWYGYPIVACDDDGVETWRSEQPICPSCGRDVEGSVIGKATGLRIIGMTRDELFGDDAA